MLGNGFFLGGVADARAGAEQRQIQRDTLAANDRQNLLNEASASIDSLLKQIQETRAAANTTGDDPNLNEALGQIGAAALDTAALIERTTGRTGVVARVQAQIEAALQTPTGMEAAQAEAIQAGQGELLKAGTIAAGLGGDQATQAANLARLVGLGPDNQPEFLDLIAALQTMTPGTAEFNAVASRINMLSSRAPRAGAGGVTLQVNEDGSVQIIPLGGGQASAAPGAGGGQPISPEVQTILSARVAPGKSIDGLQAPLGSGLAAMMLSAPGEIGAGLQIGSGVRTTEHQAELFEAEVAGVMAANPNLSRAQAEEIADNSVARAGDSHHETGEAVDLWWNGRRLDKAPAEVQQWVAQNAPNFGLHFPVNGESWHVEAVGSQAAAAPAGTAPGGAVGAIPSKQQVGGEALTELRGGIDDVQRSLEVIDILLANPPPMGVTGSVRQGFETVTGILGDLAGVVGIDGGDDEAVANEVVSQANQLLADAGIDDTISTGALGVYEGILMAGYARALQPEGVLRTDVIERAREVTKLTGLASQDQVLDRLREIREYLASRQVSLQRLMEMGVTGMAVTPEQPITGPPTASVEAGPLPAEQAPASPEQGINSPVGWARAKSEELGIRPDSSENVVRLVQALMAENFTREQAVDAVGRLMAELGLTLPE